jgi:hypothetical protein
VNFQSFSWSNVRRQTEGALPGYSLIILYIEDHHPKPGTRAIEQTNVSKNISHGARASQKPVFPISLAVAFSSISLLHVERLFQPQLAKQVVALEIDVMHLHFLLYSFSKNSTPDLYGSFCLLRKSIFVLYCSGNLLKSSAILFTPAGHK